MIKTHLNLILVLSVPVFVSCGSSGNSSNDPKLESEPVLNQNEEITRDGSNVQGLYAGEIWPVNTNLHLQDIGHVGVTRNGDNLKASVNLKHGPKGTRIKQALYNARRCPALQDDLNKDAYIDILEARIATGKMMIPFDGNLDSQSAGEGEFPEVGLDGKMSWSRTASFLRLFADLKLPDTDPEDELIKLGDEEGMTLPGRIVLFQGASEAVPLPETVGSIDGESRYKSIPIGCAVLWRVKEIPGELAAE